MTTQAETRGTRRFTVESFAQFWSKPDPSMVPLTVTADVVGHWPGAPEPVRGVVAYAGRIAELLALIPNLRLEVLEHATNGDLLFIRWRAHGTCRKGRPFALDGVDRIHLRDGLVAENVIVFDTDLFRRLVGTDLPYAPS